MAVVDDSSITPISPQRTIHTDLGTSISPILPSADSTHQLTSPSPHRLPLRKLDPISQHDKLKRKISKIRFKRRSNAVTEQPPVEPSYDTPPLPLDEDEVPPFDPLDDSEDLLASDHAPMDDVIEERTDPSSTSDSMLDLSEYSDKVLAIKLLGTDPLKPHFSLSHPLVKVTLFSDKTCQHMKKSEKDRAVSSFYETDNDRVDYILPQLTAPAAVNTCNKFTPQWREELIFNEDLVHLLSDSSLVLLFELLEFKENSRPNVPPKKGWKHIAWAFLKLTGANSCINLEKRLRLQLYCYLKSTVRCENRAFYSWYHGYRKKYPSTLHLIPRGVDMQVAPAALRSQAPNQPEIATSRGSTLKHSNCTVPSLEKQPPHWNRLSGQRCQVPDTPLLLSPLPRMGGSVVKFSPDGTCLAVALVLEEESHIAVYSVPACEEMFKFKGHHGLIYDLSWSSTCLFLSSASQDSTARVWSLSDTHPPPHTCYKLLPHPSYVYAICFHPSSEIILLTAGYDREIRVWGMGAVGVNSSQILREFRSHEGYINSLIPDPTGVRIFSGDSDGCVCVWQVAGKLESWRELDRMQLKEMQGEVIRSLSVTTRRLLVHTRDGAMRLVDMKRHAILQRYSPPSTPSTHTLSQACITPCGSHVYLGTGSELSVWELETAEKLHSFSLEHLNMSLADITCVDYHPLDHILALCTYGLTGSLLVSRYTPAQTDLSQLTSLATERPTSSLSLADTAMLSLREKVRLRMDSERPSPEDEREGNRERLSSTWDSLGSLTIPPNRGTLSPLMMQHDVITEEGVGEVTDSYESHDKSLISELTIGMLDTPVRGQHISTPVYSTSEVEEGADVEVRETKRRSAARRRRTINKQKSVVNSPLHTLTNE